jgi:hypothetical protein
VFTPVDHLGEVVEVALDLHNPHRWLIKSHEGAPMSSRKRPLNGKPRDKDKDITKEVALRNCKFYVHEAGRNRCLATGKKDLHAWVIGTVIGAEEPRDNCRREVVYDYRKHSSFVYADTNEPIHESAMAWFTYSEQDERFRVFVEG